MVTQEQYHPTGANKSRSRGPLGDSFDSGNIIEIPSLNVRTSKMYNVFPEVPKNIDEVITGVKEGFPHARIFSQEDREVRAHMEWDEYPHWRNSYIAVNEIGAGVQSHNSPEQITVTNGELIIATKPAPDITIRQILKPEDKTIVAPGESHVVYARKNWAIFHQEFLEIKPPAPK